MAKLQLQGITAATYTAPRIRIQGVQLKATGPPFRIGAVQGFAAYKGGKRIVRVYRGSVRIYEGEGG